MFIDPTKFRKMYDEEFGKLKKKVKYDNMGKVSPFLDEETNFYKYSLIEDKETQEVKPNKERAHENSLPLDPKKYAGEHAKPNVEKVDGGKYDGQYRIRILDRRGVFEAGDKDNKVAKKNV